MKCPACSHENYIVLEIIPIEDKIMGNVTVKLAMCRNCSNVFIGEIKPNEKKSSKAEEGTVKKNPIEQNIDKG